MMTLREYMQSTALSTILALAITTAPLAASQEEQRRLTLSDIAVMAKSGTGAGTSGVPGIQTTVLSGDPTAAGPYTIALRVPAHTKIAAHTHRDDRAAVVISGVWFFGYGSSADETEVRLWSRAASTPSRPMHRTSP